MAAEAVTAGRAYVLLKGDVVSGRFAPGASIVENTLSAEYGLSIAPFRDAAQRLVGERLIVFGPRGGYRMPILTEEGLRELYQWHSHLVRLALKVPVLPSGDLHVDVVDQTFDAASIAISTTNLFRAIAMRSSNGEVAHALLRAGDRLHASRLRENLVLNDLEGELRTVMMATRSGQDHNRFAVLWAYHRRRERRVSAIARLLNGRNSEM